MIRKPLLTLCAILLTCAGFIQTTARAAPVMTAFDPATHGFKFRNTFQNDLLPALDWRTGGLCGGMSYLAMDFFNAGRRLIPQQTWRPATGSILEEHLYARQKDSLVLNLDRWTEVGFNPGGARDSEFFTWGIVDRIPELRRNIDAGRPVVIGLQGHGSGSHQVVAIGYDMGRYTGNGRGPIGDFKIFCYDPNFPGRTTVIAPDPAQRLFVYESDHAREGGRSVSTFRTWFPDTRYAAARIPANLPILDFPADDNIQGALFVFDTGDDDLRGDKEPGARSFLDLEVQLRDGTVVRQANASRTARWLANYPQSIFIPFTRGLARDSIRAVKVTQVSIGGISRDNWTMKSMGVFEVGRGRNTEVFTNPVLRHGQHRFDGSNSVLDVAVERDLPGELYTQIALKILTGNDDLRGGNDNLNIILDFADGSSRTLTNVNRGVQWNNYSEQLITLQLGRSVNRTGLRQIRLQTVSGGGAGGDNWTMDRCEVELVGRGRTAFFGLSGQHRFSGTTSSIPIRSHAEIAAGRTQQLEFVFQTGGDDLRGGNDNLKIRVFARGGGITELTNANQSIQWPNDRTSHVTVWLLRPVAAEDIIRVILDTNPRTNDNWNMRRVEVFAWVEGRRVALFSRENWRSSESESQITLTPGRRG